MRGIPLRNYLRESRIFNSRITVAAILIGALTLLLLLRLTYLQVVSHRYYATLSQANRINPIPILPPRGLILDRNGVVLAQNFPVFTLEIVPDDVPELNALLAELSTLVALNERDIKNFRKLMRERPGHEPLLLRSNLTEEESAKIALNRFRFKGVRLQARLQRHYPLGGLGVHAIGYVGRINKQEQERIDANIYKGLQHIGKLGVEHTYENLLVGRVGFEYVETDAHGRQLRVLDRAAPQAGQNIYLNVDARLQALAEQELGSRKGAVIALDPRNGSVLAFASTPTYDPNAFVNGIDADLYRSLRDDTARPLINRALAGRYAPGSTIKPFYGLAALERRGFNPRQSVFCPGYFTLPGSTHRFRDWKKEGHGHVDLNGAIAQSCDIYFYRLAVDMGIDHMKDFLTRIGFGRKTGIDLAGEPSGLVPSPEWKKSIGQPWYPGETVVIGIGQGPILATPLQLASTVSTIANRGHRITPHLLYSIEDPSTKTVRYVDPAPPEPLKFLKKEHLEEAIRDMADVVHGQRGTAGRIAIGARYRIAGKTGTAQVKGLGQNERYNEKLTPERFRDHGLFIAFAPVEDPAIAIAVIVENGGSGSGAAAPIARKMMDYYLLGAQASGLTLPAIPDGE